MKEKVPVLQATRISQPAQGDRRQELPFLPFLAIVRLERGSLGYQKQNSNTRAREAKHSSQAKLRGGELARSSHLTTPPSVFSVFPSSLANLQ